MESELYKISIVNYKFTFACTANENRYEGSWKNDKKNGPGKFYYLDKGQVYEGVWHDDIPKCGEMKDFGREGAPAATQYPIPKVNMGQFVLID